MGLLNVTLSLFGKKCFTDALMCAEDRNIVHCTSHALLDVFCSKLRLQNISLGWGIHNEWDYAGREGRRRIKDVLLFQGM